MDIGGGATIQAFCAVVRVAHRAAIRDIMSFMAVNGYEVVGCGDAALSVFKRVARAWYKR